MATMDVSKLSNNQMKQMIMDKKRVILVYKQNDGQGFIRIPNDISEPLIRAFSTYCNAKLPTEKTSEKPTIVIQAEYIEAVRIVLNWILRYASGDRKLPNLGDRPLFHAVMINRTAELLGLPGIMLDEIRGAIQNLASTYLCPTDVLAIAKSSTEGSYDWKLVVDNIAQQVVAADDEKAGKIRKAVSAVPGLVEAVTVVLPIKRKERAQKDAQMAAGRRGRRGPPATRRHGFKKAVDSPSNTK